MTDITISRRTFLKGAGAATAILSLNSLGFLGGNTVANATEKLINEWQYSGWEDLHRKEWTWDKVTWGTHLVDCYPGNCLWRVYTKDGIVFREEQAAKYPVIDPSGPDFNPRGCQKGASYSLQMYNPERLKYPMKQTGGRGSGKWKRISWDQCTQEIAEGILDGLESEGPESLIFESGPGNGGYVQMMAAHRLFAGMGGTALDIDSTIGDFNRGVYETFGKFQFMDSVDGWYFGKLHLIWHMNPVYTRIPSYHFIAEARYAGAEVVTIAPDYNPSSMHADEYIPVEIGTDAALGNAVCQVLIEKGWVNWGFVKEQTDFPLLVRLDNDRFLNAEELEGGRNDQFVLWDSKNNKPVLAPLETLKLPCDPALEGTFTVTLKDGNTVQVQPVFHQLKAMLNKEYTPEQASKICKTHPDTIRSLAEKCHKAQGHIQVLVGWNSSKYYHGDLIERVMCLVLALTGSIGNKGSGIRGWAESLFEGALAQIFKNLVGFKGLVKELPTLKRGLNYIKRKDKTLTDEMAAIKIEEVYDRMLVHQTVPAFLYYEHSDYKKSWDNKAWHCPTMKREFSEYYNEAVSKGWWEGFIRPAIGQNPTVYCWSGTNPARKNRGWNKNVLNSLWKKYKTIFGFETRWTTTILYADYALPCAGFYEKLDTRFPTPHVPWLTLTDKAVKPVGESMQEWDICKMLAEKIEKEAHKRGKTLFKPRVKPMEEFKYATENMICRDKDNNIDISRLGHWQTMCGAKDFEEIFEDALTTSVFLGNLPAGTNLAKMREEGIIRFANVSPFDAVSMNLATDIKPDEPIVPLTWHTGEKKLPYPTYNRRMQFYIDHDWFLEAKEQLPVHKDNPKMGGDFPLRMTSGHQRWSVHSIWVTNQQLLRTHQGRPFMFMNTDDAKQRGIKDGDLCRVYNDFDDFKIHVKVTPAARPFTDAAMPGQVIIYHAWEPYMFEGWKSYDTAIPGVIKWLDLINNYGHLHYWRWNWCAQPIDRACSVQVEKA